MAGDLECGLQHKLLYILLFQAFPMSGTSPISNSYLEMGELFGLCALLTRDQSRPQMS
jgi:hypothetical protein